MTTDNREPVSRESSTQAQADRIQFSHGQIQHAEARYIEVNQGGIALATSDIVTVKEGGIGVAVADNVTMEGGSIAIAIAGQISSDATVLFDARAAVLFGVVAGVVLHVLKMLGGQKDH